MESEIFKIQTLRPTAHRQTVLTVSRETASIRPNRATVPLPPFKSEIHCLPEWSSKEPYFMIDPNQLKIIAGRLSDLTTQKRFLAPGYSLRHLSDDAGIQLYKLSAYINQIEGYRFNDFLNRFRIKYCTELMAQGHADRLTLEALSVECGFKNRNTFISAFKKFTGFVPSVFLKNLKAPDIRRHCEHAVSNNQDN